MSGFDALLRHTVTIVRYSQGAPDEYGQPARTPSDLATVKALIQPRGTRLGGGQSEEIVTHGGGTEVTDHTIFMRPTDITAADEIRADDAGVHTGKTFGVLLVRDEGGQGHHLAIDVRLVQPEVESA